MVTITLTEDQINQINTDLANTQLLTDDEVKALAQKLNEKINLPFIKNEEKEFIILFKIVRLIDKALYKLLPNEYYTLIHDASDGISEAEAEVLRQRLTPLLNKVIDIPILSEAMEEVVIDFILKLIITALIKGCKLGQA